MVISRDPFAEERKEIEDILDKALAENSNIIGEEIKDLMYCSKRELTSKMRLRTNYFWNLILAPEMEKSKYTKRFDKFLAKINKQNTDAYRGIKQNKALVNMYGKGGY